MAKVHVIDRDGTEHTLDAENGLPLMDTLRDESMGVEGTCGGMCSCGTCHVYVDAAWAGKLGPRSDDEQMMLEAIGDLVELKPTSRLSCQIPVSDELEGIKVTVAPEA